MKKSFISYIYSKQTWPVVMNLHMSLMMICFSYWYRCEWGKQRLKYLGKDIESWYKFGEFFCLGVQTLQVVFERALSQSLAPRLVSFKIRHIENVAIESTITHDRSKTVPSLIYSRHFICKCNVEEERRRMSFCVIALLLESLKQNAKTLRALGRHACKCRVEGQLNKWTGRLPAG